MTPLKGPEAKARERIDADLDAAGWTVQDQAEINLTAGRGVAIREFRMAKGYGVADYLLFLDGKAVGALEALQTHLFLARCIGSQSRSV